MLVGPHDRGVDVMDFPIESPLVISPLLHLPEELMPTSAVAPPVETAVDGLPVAVTFGQIAPGGSGTQHPEDAVDDRTVVCIRPSGPGFLSG